VEDGVLEAWLSYINTFKFERVSLHFDGLRVSRLDDMDVQALCRGSEKAIQERLRENRSLLFVADSGGHPRRYRWSAKLSLSDCDSLLF
jgi:hypothetical protein